MKSAFPPPENASGFSAFFGNFVVMASSTSQGERGSIERAQRDLEEAFPFFDFENDVRAQVAVLIVRLFREVRRLREDVRELRQDVAELERRGP